jgi:hypothetical protein
MFLLKKWKPDLPYQKILKNPCLFRQGFFYGLKALNNYMYRLIKILYFSKNYLLFLFN